MKPPQVVIFAVAFFTAARVTLAAEPAALAASASGVVLNEPLRAELIAMAVEDQRVRPKNGAPLTSGQWEEMHTVDARNQRRVEEIIAQYGWPGKSLVGADGASRAWLLVQHFDPVFQEKCLPLLERAVAAGEATGKNYAYLLDRVLIHQGKPQIYGTQYRTTNGITAVLPIEEPDKVDERRRSVGLGPWAEYDQQMRKRDEEALAAAKNPALRQEIFRMAAESARVHRTRPADKTEEELNEMKQVDAANLKSLREILAEQGWPGNSLVGADAAHNVSSLVFMQGGPEFWAECLPRLEQAWKAGEAGAAEYAQLVDALRTAQGRLQLYGTLSHKKDGKNELSPVEDPEHVEERRKSIGLGPLNK